MLVEPAMITTLSDATLAQPTVKRANKNMTIIKRRTQKL